MELIRSEEADGVGRWDEAAATSHSAVPPRARPRPSGG